MELFRGSFYENPIETDIILYQSNLWNYFLGRPLTAVANRYGKTAQRIYNSLIANHCISKMSYPSGNFYQLLINLFSKFTLSARRESSSEGVQKLKDFIHSLPVLQKLKKINKKIQLMLIDVKDNLHDRRTFIKKISLYKLILFIYQIYYEVYDFPLFENYFAILDLIIELYSNINDQINKSIEDELKLASNMYFRRLKIEKFETCEEYIKYYQKKKIQFDNLSGNLSKDLFSKWNIKVTWSNIYIFF